jgi:SAM-dependent methyltransferase
VTATDETRALWPKSAPPLTPEQSRAREEFMLDWHRDLPRNYGMLERFNHGYIAGLPHSEGIRTLEVGAGIGGHLPYENLSNQEYYCIEYREEFCSQLRTKLAADRIVCGSIQDRQTWPDGHFNRVVAVHVLEHLPHLPNALSEIRRLLRPDGFFDVVLPCEGGVAYELARTVSSRRYFERKFKQSYTPIIRSEHLSTLAEIRTELARAGFKAGVERHFPLLVPIDTINLCVAMRLRTVLG